MAAVRDNNVYYRKEVRHEKNTHRVRRRGLGLGPGLGGPRRGCGSSPRRTGQLFSHHRRGRAGGSAGTHRLPGRGADPGSGRQPGGTLLPGADDRRNPPVGAEDGSGRVRPLGGGHGFVVGRVPGIDRRGSTLPAAVPGRGRVGCGRCGGRAPARPSGLGGPGAPDPQGPSAGRSVVRLRVLAAVAGDRLARGDRAALQHRQRSRRRRSADRPGPRLVCGGDPPAAGKVASRGR